MRENTGIYKILNILNGKMYIGSSIDLKSRKKAHFTKLEKNTHVNSHLQNSYNKYGKENFKWEIVEYIYKIKDKTRLKAIILDREQYWIDTLNVCERGRGYNICKKANNCIGHKVSENARKNLSERQKGKDPLRYLTHDEKLAVYKKIGSSQKGRKLSEETKKKISESHKGKKLSEETIKRRKETLKNRTYKRREEVNKKLSNSLMLINRVPSESTKNILSKKCTWKKEVINIDTKEIFESIKEASTKYNIHRNNIQKVCKHTRNLAGGFRWMYHDEYLQKGVWVPLKKVRKKFFCGKKVMNLDNGVIYNSTVEAAKEVGLKSSESIRKCCLGLQNTSKGYRWKYIEDKKIQSKKYDRRKIKIQNLDTNEIFSSISEAAKSVNIKKIDSIRRVCNGIQLIAGGHRWRYIKEMRV